MWFPFLVVLKVRLFHFSFHSFSLYLNRRLIKFMSSAGGTVIHCSILKEQFHNSESCDDGHSSTKTCTTKRFPSVIIKIQPAAGIKKAPLLSLNQPQCYMYIQELLSVNCLMSFTPLQFIPQKPWKQQLTQQSQLKVQSMYTLVLELLNVPHGLHHQIEAKLSRNCMFKLFVMFESFHIGLDDSFIQAQQEKSQSTDEDRVIRSKAPEQASNWTLS